MTQSAEGVYRAQNHLQIVADPPVGEANYHTETTVLTEQAIFL